jgi:hypothetical protein
MLIKTKGKIFTRAQHTALLGFRESGMQLYGNGLLHGALCNSFRVFESTVIVKSGTMT